MKVQFEQETGIFGCDEPTIFSSVHQNLGNKTREMWTLLINQSLDAPVGGLYNMSLNTEIFLVVWRRIFREGPYRRHDWTVKVDPDAVFLANRLRVRTSEGEAQRQAKAAHGVFLNNCKIGNHGPIEVVSTLGMEVFKAGIDKCVQKNYAPVDEIGEDVFTRRCWSHLGVMKVDDFQLLSEINCFENPTPCYSGKVAFHAFKTADSLLKCLGEARRGHPVQLPAACQALGCGQRYEPGHPCQCNGDCVSHNNCCDDYKDVCVPQALI